MIPKVIHYCWFGRGKKSVLMERCIQSWSNLCPDYQIIEWNEDNFDINSHPFTKYCFENKKWANLSDLVRLIVVFREGGIYLDTDVELIKKLDPLLNNSAFFSFENQRLVNTGLGFGAEKENYVVKRMIEEYDNVDLSQRDVPNCPQFNTRPLLNLGFLPNGQYQHIHGITLLDSSYMNPLDDPTGRLEITSNTLSIHWYSKSAIPKYLVLRSKITRPIHRYLGIDFLARFKKKR